MSEPDKIEELAAKIRDYCTSAYVTRALIRLMPKTGRFEREIMFESVLSFIKNNKEASLQDRIRHIVQYRHDPDAVFYFTQALLEWYNSQKVDDQDQPGPARVTNAKPAPAAPVIRGEGGPRLDSDDEVMLVEHVPVIRPPSPGKEYDDGEVQLVGTMDEMSAAVISAQEHAKLAALVPSDAQQAEYARRKNKVDVRNIEAQAREFERLHQQARRQRAEEKLQRSREAVARALELVRIKEAELQRAKDAMVRATDMFEADERDLLELERAAKRPRGGA
jgi:hypothetical protein